jgi:hypothetical protein
VNFLVFSLFIVFFTKNFDLSKRKCLNGLFWFFLDIFYQNFQFWWRQKKCFLHSLMHRDMFLKKVIAKILLITLNHHLFLKFLKNLYFWTEKNVFFINLLTCNFLKIFKVIFTLIYLMSFFHLNCHYGCNFSIFWVFWERTQKLFLDFIFFQYPFF